MYLSPIIYYHVLCYGDWKILFQEQILKLYASGLLFSCHSCKIYLTNWTDEDYKWVMDQINGLSLCSCHKIPVEDWRREERATLLSMYSDCVNMGGDDYPILYLHTKGLTRGGYNVVTWRYFMEHFNITKWSNAVSQLSKGKDAYGVNLRDDTIEYFGNRYLHYSGNIWWSKSSYIRTLDPSFISVGDNRWHAEFWLGQRGSFETFYNALDSEVDHYHQPFEIGGYLKIIDKVL